MAAAAAAGGGESWVCAGGRQRLRRRRRGSGGGGGTQTPRSGSPRGRAPETKRSGSSGAAGGRSVSRSAPSRPAAVRANPPPPRARPAGTAPQGEKMPRVVPDQRSKFENEEFFRKLSRECEVRRTGGGQARALRRPQRVPSGPRAEKSLGRRGPGESPRPAAPEDGQSRRAPSARRPCLGLSAPRGAGGRAGGSADLAPDFGPSSAFCRLSTRASGTGPTRSARRASRTPAATAAPRS